jgi:hypothetical protein
VLTTHTFWLAVLKKRKVKDHRDFILGPVSPKEYKEIVAELNGSRTNRVFEFFKVAAPERVGFAKHREAAERKAAALAAADAPTKKTGMKNIPASAATAAAEGRARKKRGGRPADSPPAAKRTQVVDVESGVVEDVIVAVPLRSAAPSVGADEENGGPLLVPLNPKEKDSDDDSDICIVSSVGEAPRCCSPTAFGAEAPLATKADPALPPPAHPAHRPRAPSSPPPPRLQAPKKTTLSLLRKKVKKKMKKKRKSLTAATTALRQRSPKPPLLAFRFSPRPS